MATASFNEKIRIRLKAFDYRILDTSTHEIVDTARRTGARLLDDGILDGDFVINPTFDQRRRSALDPGNQAPDVVAHRPEEAFGIDAHPEHRQGDGRQQPPLADAKICHRRRIGMAFLVRILVHSGRCTFMFDARCIQHLAPDRAR